VFGERGGGSAGHDALAGIVGNNSEVEDIPIVVGALHPQGDAGLLQTIGVSGRSGQGLGAASQTYGSEAGQGDGQPAGAEWDMGDGDIEGLLRGGGYVRCVFNG